MNVTLNNPSPTSVELTIELSVEEVKPYLQAAAKRISQEIDIAGFRKGHAPYDLVAGRVGETTIYEEAFGAIVEKTYPQAVDQHELKVVGRASIDRLKLAAGNPVIYKATVGLMPTVELGDYSSLHIPQPEVALDQEKYDRTVKDLRQAYASQAAVDRPAALGDMLNLDFAITVDGVAIEGGQATKQEIRLEKGAFVEDFLNNLVGMSAGESKQFSMKFPKTYHAKALQGKTGDVTATVHTVLEVTLPEWNDEFAKTLQFESLEQLEQSIKERIMQELQQESVRTWENDIVQAIVKQATISDLPDNMIDEEVAKMISEMKQDLSRQQMKFEDYLTHLKKTEAELESEFRPMAVERLQAALVLRELAVAEKITVDSTAVDAKLEEIKKQFETMPEMAGYVTSPAYRDRLENQMIHDVLFEKIKQLVSQK